MIFNDPATTQPIPKAPIVPPNFPPSKDPCPQSLDDIAARHADFKVLLDQMKKMKNCPMPEVICASCDSADPRYKTGGVYFDPPAGLNKRGGLMILCSGVWNDEIAFHELRHMLQYCKQANGQSPFIPGVIRTSPVNGVSDNCMKHAGREFDAYYYTSCRSFASPSDRCECAMNGCKGSAIGACKNLLDNPTAQANAESACEAVKKEYEQKDCANSGVLALV